MTSLVGLWTNVLSCCIFFGSQICQVRDGSGRGSQESVLYMLSNSQSQRAHAINNILLYDVFHSE